MTDYIKLGNAEPTSYKVGTNNVDEIYLGTVKLYPKVDPLAFIYKATKYNDDDYTYECTTATTTATTAITRACATLSTITGETLQQGSPIAMDFGNCTEAIGQGACSGWTHLTSVTFADSVTSIGNYAFAANKKYLHVTFGSGLTSIGDYAFYQNLVTSDTSVFDVDLSMCTNLSSIGEYGFYYSGARRVTLPNANLTIGKEAFRASKRLTDLTLGSGNTLGLSAFTYCTSLSSVTFANQTTIPNQAFNLCISLPSVTLPDSVTTINDKAFYQCSGMTSVEIGSGVSFIGVSGFANCHALTSITIHASTPPQLNSSAFDNSALDNCPIYVPSGSVSAYQSATNWSNYSNRIQAIPNS